MAFEDSNDIKISVTLDADNAIKQAEALKKTIEDSFGTLSKQLKGVQNILDKLDTKGLDKLRAAYAKDVEELKLNNQLKLSLYQADLTNQRKVVLDGARIKQAEVDSTRKANQAILSLEEERLKAQSKINLERVRTDEKIRLANAKARIKESGPTDQNLFEKVTGKLGGASSAATGLAASVYLIKTAFDSLKAAVQTVDQIGQAIDGVAQQANSLEGLKTGFQTLQNSVGNVPLDQLNKLRQATQGLVSDTDLYQRANQAVLLGVPTKVFNEAAAAAVKLGRAMGIDAAFGLESLSLGLGRQSRLYLDNLGIVVQAEDAYRNFATANNIVGRELTDSEKKAAFYAEALKKIKERADELPDPIDTVGVSLQRLTVAQENANAKTLEGFNGSQELKKSYQQYTDAVVASSAGSEKFGQALGVVSSLFKDVQTGLFNTKVFFRDAATSFVDLFADLGPEQRAESLRKKISELEKEVTRLLDLQQERGGSFMASLVKSAQINLDQARKSLQDTEAEIERLRMAGNNPLKLRVDLSEINTAQKALRDLFATLRTDALADADIFEVPGFSDQQVENVKKQTEELSFALNSGRISKQEFDKEFKKVQDAVGLAAYTEESKKTAAAIEKVMEARQNDLVTQEKANLEIEELITKNEALRKEYGLSAEQVTKLSAVLKASQKTGKKRADEAIADAKRVGKASENTFKQQQREFEQFAKGIKRISGVAIPEEFQRELIGVFKDAALSADEFAEKIIEIGQRAQKAGVDLGAIRKEAGELQEIGEKVGFDKLERDAKTSKEVADNIEAIKEAQKGMPNLNKLLFGTESGQGGGFFGFDLGSVDLQGEQVLADTLQQSLSSAFQMAINGFSRNDAPEIGAAVGAVLGGAIAAAIGVDPSIGVAIGSVAGQALGSIAQNFGQDSAGTKARKKVDEYFAELFDGQRLGVIIQGEVYKATASLSTLPMMMNQIEGEMTQTIAPTFTRLSDLVFNGFTAFAGNVRYGIEEAANGFNSFSSYFNTLSSSIQNSFTGVGVAFGSLLGLTEEQSKMIGTAIANNIGGSLQNLQVFIQQTGESFDNLAKAVVDSFLSSTLSIEQAYNSLVQLESLYAVGIPGAVGAYQQAIDNLNNSLQSDAPGRYATDSLRDIGAEAIEAGASFETAISSLGRTFSFTADQQVRLFEALKINGITSLAELQKASDAQLLAILRNIQIIQERSKDPLVTTPQTTLSTNTGTRSSSSGKKDPIEDVRKRIKEQTNDLLKADQRYLDILDKVKNNQLGQASAGKEVLKVRNAINAQVDKLLMSEYKLDIILNKPKDKRTKEDIKNITKLGEAIRLAQEEIDKIKGKADETNRVFKQINLSGVIPLITNMNQLGVVANQTGVDLQKNIDILVKGFLQGRLSIEDVNAEIAKTKELLGPGIPNAVGAVKDAFQNLIDAGRNGGKFSTDAFVDIFAEFREKFQKESGAIREAQRQVLNANLDAARATFNTATDPTAAAAALNKLNEAKAALETFNASVDAPNLTDLREELLKTFSGSEVDKFFQALDESGIKGFDEFAKAGDEAIIGILGRLSELGFQFNQTTGDISGINNGLQQAEKDANAGLDPLAEAIKLVKEFNSGAATLPPVFNSTTQAIAGMNGPLSQLKDGFAGVQEKLSLLSGQTYNTTVVFDVKTVGDDNSKTLVDLIFGSGKNTTTGTGGDGGGTGTKTGLTPQEEKELQGKIKSWKTQLEKLRRNRQTNTSQYKRIQKLIQDAEAKLN